VGSIYVFTYRAQLCGAPAQRVDISIYRIHVYGINLWVYITRYLDLDLYLYIEYIYKRYIYGFTYRAQLCGAPAQRVDISIYRIQVYGINVCINIRCSGEPDIYLSKTCIRDKSMGVHIPRSARRRASIACRARRRRSRRGRWWRQPR